MSERRDLERRLHMLADIGNIMRALKNLSLMETARLHRFMDAQRRVVQSMQDAATDLLSHFPLPLEPESGQAGVYILIGSERGFCGDYNETLAGALDKHLKETKAASSTVVALGQKLTARMEGYPGLAASLSGPSVAEEVPEVLVRLIETLNGLELPQGAFSPLSLTVLHHEVVHHESRVQINRPLQALKEGKRRYTDPPLLQLEPFALFEELLDQYLFAALHEIFYSALLAEHQQRLQHLEGALQRLDRRQRDFHRRQNVLRQEEITQEIEIILLSAGVFQQQTPT